MRTYTFVRRDDAEECERHLKRTRERLKAGLEAPLAKILFLDFAANWLDERTRTNPKSTWAGEESKLRNVWLPYLGQRPMDSIRRGEIENKLKELILGPDQIGPATRNHHRTLLNRIFKAALRSDPPTCRHNPIADIPKLKVPKKTRRHWKSMDDAEKYIAAMYTEDVVVGVASELDIFGGPRVSELLVLRWGDVDTEAGKIRIEKIIELVSGEEKQRTKGQGEGGGYDIALLPRIRQALDRLRAGREVKPNEYIFMTTMKGRYRQPRPMTYSYLRGCGRRACASLGLPYVSPHGLRHTCATLMQRAGIGPDARKIALGHSDIKTTERYSHADLSHVVEEATKRGYGAAVETKLRAVKK